MSDSSEWNSDDQGDDKQSNIIRASHTHPVGRFQGLSSQDDQLHYGSIASVGLFNWYSDNVQVGMSDVSCIFVVRLRSFVLCTISLSSIAVTAHGSDDTILEAQTYNLHCLLLVAERLLMHMIKLQSLRINYFPNNIPVSRTKSLVACVCIWENQNGSKMQFAIGRLPGLYFNNDCQHVRHRLILIHCYFITRFGSTVSTGSA